MTLFHGNSVKYVALLDLVTVRQALQITVI